MKNKIHAQPSSLITPFEKKVFTIVHVVIHRPQNGKAACIRVISLPSTYYHFQINGLFASF